MYTNEENIFEKWFKRPELGMTLFGLTALSLGYSFFLMTLMIFLCLINTGILEMVGLKALSFAKARNLLGVSYIIFNWLLMMLRETISIQRLIGSL
jgi:hypothetical protein